MIDFNDTPRRPRMHIDLGERSAAFLAGLKLNVPMVGQVTANDLVNEIRRIHEFAQEQGISLRLRVPSPDQFVDYGLLGAAIGATVAAAVGGGVVLILGATVVGGVLGALSSTVTIDIRRDGQSGTAALVVG